MGAGPAPLHHPGFFQESNPTDPNFCLESGLEVKLCLPNPTQHLDFPGLNQRKTLENSASPSHPTFGILIPGVPEPPAHPGKLRNL